MDERQYATKKDLFEIDKRLTVAEAHIKDIKEDIKEIKDNTRNSYRVNMTTLVTVGVAVIGWLIVLAMNG